MRTDTQRLDYVLTIVEQQDEEAADKLGAAYTLGFRGRVMVDAAMGARIIEPGQPMPELTAMDLVGAELGRIRNVKGFSEERDDSYTDGELADAAICYLLGKTDMPAPDDYDMQVWPWGLNSFRPSPDDRKKELTKGIALAVCELDRLIRAERRADEAGLREHLESPEHQAYVDKLCEPEGEAQVCAEMNAAACVPALCENPNCMHVFDAQLAECPYCSKPQPREFKVGDRVRVVCGSDWAGWFTHMDYLIGNEYVVSDVHTKYAEVDSYQVPLECLEHVDG